MKIKFFEMNDRNRWDQYVLKHPHGTFFHLTGWKHTIEKTFGHKSFYLIAEESIVHYPSSNEQISQFSHAEKIVGILPLFSIKSLIFGNSLVSIPFAAYGGILADNNEIALELLDKAKEITRELKLDYLELRHLKAPQLQLPIKNLYYTFRREIYPDIGENMKSIPRKSRRMIRLGEKNNLKYIFGQENFLRAFYDIFARSYHYLGTPIFPEKFLRQLMKEFQNQCNVLIINNSKGKNIAGVMSFFYKKELLPFYAGSLFKYRNLAPNDFMYWQLMKYGCENGYSIFDFGRSKINTGSFDFKRHWGFEPEPLFYQFFLNCIKEIPNISPMNPRYRKSIYIWQKLPFWSTKLIGPKIVKYIP
jgi:FemAB-related protein (PEP-CTERM system-associated)